MPSILSLTNIEAREYFLEEKNYVNFDIPPYVTFDKLLQKLSQKIGDSPISSYFRLPSSTESSTRQVLNPKNFENVNYRLFGNKDGGFAWRPFEMIHPALYVALVHDITSEVSWEEIKNAFKKCENSAVSCESLPQKSDDDTETHKAEQVKKWWTNVEQASLKLGLRFQYVIDVDISNCYGSIYTHSISWALHGKEVMKYRQNRNDAGFLGNRIDWMLQKMRYGQTNGIPQGSALMDLIAEIVLSYVDTVLTDHLQGVPTENFSIIRYRDDYKIFTNRPELGQQIVKELSEILSLMSMHLNTNKTKMRADPILASIKDDKMYELFIPRNQMILSKWLVQIYSALEEYPNSGMVARQLDRFEKILHKSVRLGEYDDVSVMISIVVNIAVKNPRTYPYCMAILSKLLSFCNTEKRVEIINQIINKFKSVPNTGLLDIWLQRVSYKIDQYIPYNEPLTDIVSEKTLRNLIWDSSWLKTDIGNMVSNTPIINRAYLSTMDPVIPLEEVALFNPLILS